MESETIITLMETGDRVLRGEGEGGYLQRKAESPNLKGNKLGKNPFLLEKQRAPTSPALHRLSKEMENR
jgi:hypothetical protein